MIEKKSGRSACGHRPDRTHPVPGRRRGGFSLVEVTIAALLSSMLLLMVAGMWQSIGRSTRANLASVALATEARLAAEAFRRDFSGQFAGGQPGDKRLGRLVGRMIVDGNHLRLCYDGAPPNGEADWAEPDQVVEYFVDQQQLLRTDSQSAGALVVADGVIQFTVTDWGTGVRIELTLQHGNDQRIYTWVTNDP